MVFQAVNSRSALSRAGNNGQGFAHIRSIIRAQVDREAFWAGIGSFWRISIDDPDAFPPEVLRLFLQSSLTALGEKCRAVCVDVEAACCSRSYASVGTVPGGSES